MTEKFKTDVRMLPQFGPLEGQAVDNPRGRDETGLLGNLGVTEGQSPSNIAQAALQERTVKPSDSDRRIGWG